MKTKQKKMFHMTKKFRELLKTECGITIDDSHVIEGNGKPFPKDTERLRMKVWLE